MIAPATDGDTQVHATTLTPVPRLALSRRDAAAACGISERLLWTETNRGNVPHIKVGRRVLYRPVDLERWLAASSAGGGA